MPPKYPGTALIQASKDKRARDLSTPTAMGTGMGKGMIGGFDTAQKGALEKEAEIRKFKRQELSEIFKEKIPSYQTAKGVVPAPLEDYSQIMDHFLSKGSMPPNVKLIPKETLQEYGIFNFNTKTGESTKTGTYKGKPGEKPLYNRYTPADDSSSDTTKWGPGNKEFDARFTKLKMQHELLLDEVKEADIAGDKNAIAILRKKANDITQHMQQLLAGSMENYQPKDYEMYEKKTKRGGIYPPATDWLVPDKKEMAMREKGTGTEMAGLPAPAQPPAQAGMGRIPTKAPDMRPQLNRTSGVSGLEATPPAPPAQTRPPGTDSVPTQTMGVQRPMQKPPMEQPTGIPEIPQELLQIQVQPGQIKKIDDTQTGLRWANKDGVWYTKVGNQLYAYQNGQMTPVDSTVR